MARLIGFIGPSYQSLSVNANCQRSINLYPEMDLSGTLKEKEVATLVSTPGLRRLINAPTDFVVRGLYLSSRNDLYIVSKDKLYQISSDFSITEIGTLEEDNSPNRVYFTDNGDQLCFVDGTYGYIVALAPYCEEAYSAIELLDQFMTNWTTEDLIHGYEGDGPTEPIPYNKVRVISDEYFEGAINVGFMDGYFIFVKPESNKFYISRLYDGSSFDGTMYAHVESTPANLTGMITNGDQIWMFSGQGTEIYYDSGNEYFPIEPVPGSFTEHGCKRPETIAKINGIVMWVGQDKYGTAVVWASTGGEPVRKSTPPIEIAIQRLIASGSHASAYTYSQNGLDFYVLNLAGSYSTYVFDIKNDLWHERASKAVYEPNNWYYDADSDGLSRHRVEMLVQFNGAYVCTDYATSSIYELTSEEYTDDGAPIQRIRVSPHYSEGLKNTFWRSLQLDMETGLGGITYYQPSMNAVSLLDEFMTNWTTNDLVTGYTGVGLTEPKVFPVITTTETAKLYISDDGGHTYTGGLEVNLGAKPNYATRVVWRRLGKARDRVLKIKLEGNIPITLLGLEAFIEGGSH